MTKKRSKSPVGRRWLLAATLAVLSALPAFAQLSDAGQPAPVLKALEGEVYRGETDGVVVLLSWEQGDRLELFIMPPASSARAWLVCVKPDLDELPGTLECDFSRGLQLSRSGAELNVVLNPVLAKETSVGSSGEPGPSRFTLRRVNAITTAYDPALFDPGVRYQPNSSTESRRLAPLVGKQRLRPVTREWLEAGVRRAGFDPMSLSLNRVNRLRSHIEEKLNSCCDPSWTAASEAEREHVLGERLQDALDQAHERMRRWQERRKGP